MCFLAVLLLLPAFPGPAWSAMPSSDLSQADGAYGRMPILFIPNQGQMDKQVAFSIQGRDKTIYFTSQGLTFALSVPEPDGAEEKQHFLRDIEPAAARDKEHRERWVVKLDFVDARGDVLPESLEAADTVISYFRGKPEEWHTGIQASSKIIYRDLWPGIDLVYYGTVNRLKYDFIVHPGADPGQIRLAYRGVDGLELTEEGRLLVSTPAGAFHDDIPVAWQDLEEGRQDISVAYAMEQAPHVQVASLSSMVSDAGQALGIGAASRTHGYGFTVGDYDRSKPLVLDPAVLIYCGFIGGSGDDRIEGIAVDSAGNAYVAGHTTSTQGSFPVSVGPDLTHNGDTDAFVAKVNASGTALVYCGYIGGSESDDAIGIAVDSAGSAYVTGETSSSPSQGFPVIVGPYLTKPGGSSYVAKINAGGTDLVYCGYIGSGRVRGIAVDGDGNAYVAGFTSSTVFPTFFGPGLTHRGGVFDAFVAKVNPWGTGLVYSGYIGGTANDYATGIAVDSQGNAYVTGYTNSSQASFPVLVGPDLTYNGTGDDDAFVAKINTTGTLVYCGYIGGTGMDHARGIAVDSGGNAYVTGYTDSGSGSFPVTVGPDLSNALSRDAFVAKVNPGGTALLYCGYIGGSNTEYATDIAVDSEGNAYVTGYTNTREWSNIPFPVTGGPDLTYNGGEYDGFVARVNAGGTALEYCGYIGGLGDDRPMGIAVDSTGYAYVAGYTNSTHDSFPVLGGPDLTYNGGDQDAFVTRIGPPINKVFPWNIFLPPILFGAEQ
jgi:hypothetical protein